MIKSFLTALIIAILLLSSISSVVAQSNDSSVSGQIMKVNKVTNLRDRLRERITLFFKFSNSGKVDYQQYLVQKRFAELKYVIENGRGDLIEDTSSRYSTYLGRLTNLIVKNKMVDKKGETIKMFESHLPILEDLSSDQEYNSGFWLLLQHDINYLKLYADQIENVN
ncbi:MAG: DUF5667 domain-containing protein [Patescibacteria group bacterium]